MTRRFFLAIAVSALCAVAQGASVQLVAPEDGATYDLHSPCVKEFLANFDKRGEKPPRPPLTEEEIKTRDRQNADYEAWVQAGRDKATKKKPWQDRFNFYMNNAWSAELMARAEQEEKVYKPCQWKSDGPFTNAVVEFSETADFANPIIETIVSDKPVTAMRPGFLKLGRKYFWRVTVTDDSGAKSVSDVRSFKTSEIPPRMIGVPSLNMRDMGGGVNADGIRVRQGLLYRGQASAARASREALHDLYVRKLGIRTELDLRGEEEFRERCRQWGETDLATLGIRHVFHPIIPYHVHYPPNLPEFRKIFTFLADAENYPLYFNCAVGSDRTGTIAFLLDGVIGREDRYFYDNYELPSFNPNLPRYRYCRKGSELFTTFAPKDGGTIRESVVQYLLGIGVTQAEIDSIRKIMVEK